MAKKARDPLAIEIGRRSRLVREARGLSQAQAAVQFGLEESTYRSYELGDSMMPIAVLRQMPRVYQVTVAYILGLPEEPAMSDEARLLAADFDATRDPELRRIDLETVERNFRIDQRMRETRKPGSG